MFRRKIEFIDLIILLIIRYLYLYLTVSMLEGVWYRGYGSYGIQFSIEREMLAGIVFLGMAFLYILRMQEGSFKGILIHILFCIYYIPLNCSYSLNSLSLTYFVASTLYALLIILLLTLQNSDSTVKSDKQCVLSNKLLYDRLLWLILCIICILYIMYKISYNGLNFSLSLSQDDVYTNRADYVDYREGISGSIMAYTITLLTSVSGYVCPVFLYMSLKRKNSIGITLSVVTLLSLFSVSSSKSSLFFVGILIYVLVCEHYGWLGQFNKLFTRVFLMMMLVTLVEYLLTGKSIIYWNLLRREMYIPSWMGSMYFDYFTEHSALFFSDSAFLLQTVIPDKYALTSVELISDAYFNNAIPSPNSGLLAEAIMQCGYLGVVVFPPLVYLLLSRVGKVFASYGLGLSSLIAVKVALQLTNIPILRTDSVLSIFAFTLLMAAILYLNAASSAEHKLVTKDIREGWL